MKSRFHDWGKVSCFLLYSIISAIFSKTLLRNDFKAVAAKEVGCSIELR